jgi:hypothetical protein
LAFHDGFQKKNLKDQKTVLMAQMTEARIPYNDLSNHTWSHYKPNAHIYKWFAVARISKEWYIEKNKIHKGRGDIQ